MTAILFARRFLASYARNLVNVLFLVLVPVTLVVVAASSMSGAARLLGGEGHGSAVQTVTAGWAAGFLAAIAMYFQVSAARRTDRRLVISGLPAARLVTARLMAGLALAVLASAAALTALAARGGGITDPVRVTAGTLMFAVIYLAIGAAVGAAVTNPVNGTTVILFIWITDIFFGPVLGSEGRAATRALPTHFVSLWMTGLRSGHAGRLGDLGWALAWTLGAAAAGWAVLAAATRTARPRRRLRSGTLPDQLIAALRAGVRDWARNRVLWALLAVVPAIFILLATALTPSKLIRMPVTAAGRSVSMIVNLASIHPATMAPIAIASLAALAGMFIMLDSRAGDQRLVLAGQRTGALLAARLALIAAAAAVATGVSLAVTAAVSDIRQWPMYAASNALIAITYALIGVLIGPLFGRVAGVFIAFLLPFLDLGLAQSPMLHPVPAGWAHFLPGYGGSRILIDAILVPGFTQGRPLLIALAWLAALLAAAALLFRHTMQAAAPAAPRG
jgi:hypothetical protein